VDSVLGFFFQNLSQISSLIKYGAHQIPIKKEREKYVVILAICRMMILSDTVLVLFMDIFSKTLRPLGTSLRIEKSLVGFAPFQGAVNTVDWGIFT
jgi:hypothetical protein